MTAPSYTTDLLDLIDFETSATLNTEVTGYTATSKPTTSQDFPIQGTGHADAEQRATGNGSLVADYGSGVSWTSGDYVFMWGVFLAPAAVNTWAGAGISFYVGADTSNGYKWVTGGSDFGRYPYGGWQNFVVDPELTTGRTNVGSGAGTTYRWFGILCNVVNAISKGSPYGIDVIRYGRGELIVTNGETGDYATFDGMAAENDDNTISNNRWGLFSLQGGSYIWKGLMSLGTASVSADFRDSNRNIVIENSVNVNLDFNAIEVNHASSNIEWENINITGLGTISPGTFEMVADATVSKVTCVFSDMDTFTYLTNAVISNCTYLRCGQVLAGGGSFDGCSVLDSTVTSDTGAIYCNTAYGDTDFDNMTFSMGDSSHHAIDFGTSVTSNLTLRNCDFSGFGSTDDSDDSTVRFLATSGSLTLSLESCTVDGAAASESNFSVDDAAGITVTLSIDPVTVQATVTTATGVPVSAARVFIQAKDGTGPLPFEDTVTISNSTYTATVTAAAHGMIDNDYVFIDGGSLPQNEGVWQITVLDANTYTYTMVTSAATNPTGTIESTFVALYGLTDVNGVISTSRVYPSDQPVSGWARKSTTSPYYKQGPITGTVDAADGLLATAVLVLDE